MNPAVAAFIAAMSCAQPALDFRTFFHEFFLPVAEPGQWSSGPEYGQQVFIRIANGQADYLEYRMARFEKCGSTQ